LRRLWILKSTAPERSRKKKTSDNYRNERKENLRYLRKEEEK